MASTHTLLRNAHPYTCLDLHLATWISSKRCKPFVSFTCRPKTPSPHRSSPFPFGKSTQASKSTSTSQPNIQPEKTLTSALRVLLNANRPTPSSVPILPTCLESESTAEEDVPRRPRKCHLTYAEPPISLPSVELHVSQDKPSDWFTTQPPNLEFFAAKAKGAQCTASLTISKPQMHQRTPFPQ